jgi:hypothetical protein
MSELEIRKTVTVVENIFVEAGRELPRPLRLVAACAVVKNPYAGIYQEDLSLLKTTFGETLGKELSAMAVEALDRTPRLYGKGAIVGLAGEIEHGSQIIHGGPLGRELRAASGLSVLIPSVEKRAPAGSSFDLALRNGNDTAEPGGTDLTGLFSWEVRVTDAPHPDEILIVIALGDGPRPGQGIRGAS